MAGMPPLKQRVAAGRRFASTSKTPDTSTYKYALSEAQKAGGVQRAGKAKGTPGQRKRLLSSYSRRTTETSRRRALRKLLGGYGLTTKENA
jgi:hypothetical protein